MVRRPIAARSSGFPASTPGHHHSSRRPFYKSKRLRHAHVCLSSSGQEANKGKSGIQHAAVSASPENPAVPVTSVPYTLSPSPTRVGEGAQRYRGFPGVPAYVLAPDVIVFNPRKTVSPSGKPLTKEPPSDSPADGHALSPNTNRWVSGRPWHRNSRSSTSAPRTRWWPESGIVFGSSRLGQSASRPLEHSAYPTLADIVAPDVAFTEGYEQLAISAFEMYRGAAARRNNYQHPLQSPRAASTWNQTTPFSAFTT
ncbi:hypothetical protein HPB50_002208 [Hyalomma asiaticum]|uniref:Uncharacterized protein n=1 Tax=Hyalomma asiaticum TaxID=266040 RepID=A0ACB7SIX4_HYAAI|nr:hypothetical protein HPB50_002208 [Hyalomma asiaticum]